MRRPTQPERFSSDPPRATQCPVCGDKVEQLLHAGGDCGLTLDVEARALTTPVTSDGKVNDSESDGDETVGGPSEMPSETGFDRDGRSHHSAPIVHSLS